jgi:hypothetical protein|tara:strand:- start:465 stop:662 length:198 start_codon:yes stop_codon:yes gene_type:complete
MDNKKYIMASSVLKVKESEEDMLAVEKELLIPDGKSIANILNEEKNYQETKQEDSEEEVQDLEET